MNDFNFPKKIIMIWLKTYIIDLFKRNIVEIIYKTHLSLYKNKLSVNTVLN